MKYKMSIFTLLTIFFVCLNGSAYTKENRESTPTKKNKQRFEKACSPDRRNHPEFDNSVFAEADFIYWYVDQEGNAYASTGSYFIEPRPLVPISYQGQVYAPNSKANPGFKVALGSNLSFDQWDVLVRYSWLNSNPSSSVTSTDGYSGIVPLFIYSVGGSGVLSLAGTGGSVDPTTYVSEATANWHYYLNAIDSELGKTTFVTPAFDARVNFGLKGSWQRETLNLQYLVTHSTGLLGNNTINCNQFFWGIGPRVGIDTDWNILPPYALFNDSNLSANLVAASAISALFSNFSVVAKSFDTEIGSYSSILVANQKYSVTKLIPVVEMLLGVEIKGSYSDCSRWVIGLGWENQIWFSMNQHSSSVPDIDLSFSGLTFKARYDF